MGFVINQNKLKRNRVIRKRSTNYRSSIGGVHKGHSITEILPIGAWKGKTCFLIGGGPSLKDFDFSPIKNELTIGINKSFVSFPTTINYAMDDRFYYMVTGVKKGYARKPEYKEIQKQWLEYDGIKLFIRRSVKTKYDSSVYVVNDLHRKMISFDLKKGIYGGNNSGFGALMLAIALGCKRIGLLGYDLKVQGKGKGMRTHFHEGYSFQNSDTFQSKLDVFKKCFEEFSLAILQQDIEVINLNFDSTLDCFPKDSLTNFLK